MWTDEWAQGLAEYGLILAIIVIGVFTSLSYMVKAIPSGIQPLANELSK